MCSRLRGSHKELMWWRNNFRLLHKAFLHNRNSILHYKMGKHKHNHRAQYEMGNIFLQYQKTPNSTSPRLETNTTNNQYFDNPHHHRHPDFRVVSLWSLVLEHKEIHKYRTMYRIDQTEVRLHTGIGSSLSKDPGTW